VSDIQRESRAIHDSIWQNDFHCDFEALKKKYQIAVYVPRETILMEMAAKIKPAIFLSRSLGILL
jgi:hypothetical protein